MASSGVGWFLSVIFLWSVISGVLLETDDIMDSTQKLVEKSECLCAGEQDFVERRKTTVMESINRLGINCSADSVPHIVLLPSGGGQRSAVALLGLLHQMETDGLLDSLLYMGSVSGSTWSMSSLYADPLWSRNLDSAVSRLTGPGPELDQVLTWLNQRSQRELFSLTDVWGAFTSAAFMRQMDERRLSHEVNRDVTNPYPLYSAVDKGCLSNGPVQAQWFELSPHQSGFTELGLFVETSLLGSLFQDGRLMQQQPEMDMVELQGVLGCALAHEEVIKDFIPPWMNVPEQVDSAVQYVRVYNALDKLMVLISGTTKDPSALVQLQTLQQTLRERVSRNDSAALESKNPDERKRLFEQWIMELVTEVDTWCQTQEDGDFKTHTSALMKQVLPLIVKWEWGTTRNFLYQHKDAPSCLSTREVFHLVDAGLLINVAYAPFLGPKRDIDLMIVPEFSAGLMFETLTLARDYAATLGKNFPTIPDEMLEERAWPKDCYVLEGRDQELTIVYMPLFNRQNCRDAQEVEDMMNNFKTFQQPFSDENIGLMLEMAKSNMKNNKETLLREINKALVRRQNKTDIVRRQNKSAEQVRDTL